jgi:hypothetical protein
MEAVACTKSAIIGDCRRLASVLGDAGEHTYQSRLMS